MKAQAENAKQQILQKDSEWWKNQLLLANLNSKDRENQSKESKISIQMLKGDIDQLKRNLLLNESIQIYLKFKPSNESNEVIKL